MKYNVLKCSTSGLEPEIDKLTEIIILTCDGNVVLNEYHSYINPEMVLGEEVQALSGITNEMVANTPKFDDIEEKVVSILGDLPIVGHNVSFDLSFLNKQLKNRLTNGIMDTLRISKAIIGYTGVPNYRLKTLCEYYNIDNSKYNGATRSAYNAHDLFEAMLPKLIERKRKLDEMRRS